MLLVCNLFAVYCTTVDSLDYHTLDTTKVEIAQRDYKINDKGEIVEVGDGVKLITTDTENGN